MAHITDNALKIGVRLLLLAQVSMCLMVEITGLNADYNNLRNAGGIIKTNHIPAMDTQETESQAGTKETLPLADINALTRVGMDATYDGFSLNNIRQVAAPPGESHENHPHQSVDKINRYESTSGNNEVPCSMDIEYKLTKRVPGRCANLGRSARGCIAGSYLQMFHPACF